MTNISLEGQQIISKNINQDDTVIIAPLNWGLGHASRCIPLIQHLTSRCKKIMIASDGQALALLQMEFPQLDFYLLPSYNIKYTYDSIALNLFLQIPSLLLGYIREKKEIRKLVKVNQATVVISDNRFGCRANGIKNIYITHQLTILHPSPILSAIATRIHQLIIRKFNSCWVPDNSAGTSLAGKLSISDGYENVHYIGPLTRITHQELATEWDICVLMSGPEPQRTKLESSLLQTLNQLKDYRILFIRGTNTEYEKPSNMDQINIKNVLTSVEVAYALNTSKILICRSGYSTIMDITSSNIKAIFIPTPGQTEQEYLADLWSKKQNYHMLTQDSVSRLPKFLEQLLK